MAALRPKQHLPARSSRNWTQTRRFLPLTFRAATPDLWILAVVFAGLFIQPLPALAQVKTVYGVKTLAGTTPLGDGGLAINAIINGPTELIADSAGSLYFSQSGGIRRILPNGVISTIAIVSAGGGPATETGFGGGGKISMGRGNTILSLDFARCRLWRIDLSTGRISHVAGNGQCMLSSDGSNAAVSPLDPFLTAQEDSRGRIWFTSPLSPRIKRIETDGRISTVAGNGTQGDSGDDGPASAATVATPSLLALDPSGNIYFFDGVFCKVRKISAEDGRITLVAGSFCGFSGDGGIATSARIDPNPTALYVDKTGDFLYVVGGNRIRRVDLKSRQIKTIAGNGQIGLAPDSADALQAPLNYAWGIVQTNSGQLAFSEYRAGRIRQIDAAGQVRTVAGRPVSPLDGGKVMEAVMDYASTVIPDANGAFAFGDRFRIRYVDPNGVVSTIAGSGDSSASPPDGANAKLVPLGEIRSIAKDSAGNFYYQDDSGRIRKIAPNGVLSTINRTALGSFPQSSIALSPIQDALFVSESPGSRIVRIDLLTGALSTYAGRGQPNTAGTFGFAGDGSIATQALLSFPTNLAFDRDGNLYFQDFGNARIRRVAASGIISTVAGSGQRGLGGEDVPALTSPIAAPNPLESQGPLSVDDQGNIYFVENYRIRRIDARTGTVKTIAGGLEPGFSGDGGPALLARFNFISSIAIDSVGQIYVSDAGNGRIRLLTPMAATAPTITGAVQPGNFGGKNIAAPGGYVEIYGTNFSEGTRVWAGSDFIGSTAPMRLDNLGVEVGGRPAFVQLVSPNQINAIIPDGISPGNTTLRVVGPGGTSDPFPLAVRSRAPALLAPPAFARSGLQYVVAFLPDGSFAGPPELIPGVAFRPAKAQESIVMYGIGFGAVSPMVPAGTISAVPTSIPNCTLTIGDTTAIVEYAGLAVGFVGLYQLNAVVPDGVSGNVKIALNVEGTPMDQSLFISVQ